jgi:hypothetical protein
MSYLFDRNCPGADGNGICVSLPSDGFFKISNAVFCSGNPVGGVVFSTAFGGQVEEVFEWTVCFVLFLFLR